MASYTDALLFLKDSVDVLDDTPCCTGTIPLAANAATIFYKSDQKAKLLDFAHPVSEAQLEDLLKACQPAQSGFNQQPEARTMDVRHFATHLSPADLGIVEIIHDILLQGYSNRKSIRVELCKLNVYGTGAFSAARVDTRPSDRMFGSLVVILPTVHQGGSVVVRQSQREWTFDTAKAVRVNPGVNNASTTAAAFVAFFSDVEHEITTVTSGYRVALTYNLYLRDPNLSEIH